MIGMVHDGWIWRFLWPQEPLREGDVLIDDRGISTIEPGMVPMHEACRSDGDTYARRVQRDTADMVLAGVPQCGSE